VAGCRGIHNIIAKEQKPREGNLKMLITCSCFKRMCKHYEGIEDSNPEPSARHICKAFPKGIPDEVVVGENDHLSLIPGQNSDEIYEGVSDYAEMEMFKPKGKVFQWLK
jgi:hypothetical protein